MTKLNWEDTLASIKSFCRSRDESGGIWVLGKMLWLMGRTFDVPSVAYGLFYQEEAVLSDRKRNQSLYQPLVWDQLPLPVSLALGDLKSFSKKEAGDHDRYVIKYKHRHHQYNHRPSKHRQFACTHATHPIVSTRLNLTGCSSIPALCELLEMLRVKDLNHCKPFKVLKRRGVRYLWVALAWRTFH